MIIGERIKKERFKRHMSQQELGDILNVSKVSVCGYETGMRTPSLETFVDLLDALEVSPEYLLGREKKILISDPEEPYVRFLSKEDYEIIKTLKLYPRLYQKLCCEPKRTCDLLDRKCDL